MKLKYSIEISPIVALLLILLAVVGIDTYWLHPRKPKRVQTDAAQAHQPFSATLRRPQEPSSRQTGSAADVVIERDTPSALRRSSRLATPEELNARAGRIGLQAATEYYASRKGQVVDVQHQ